MPAGQAFGMRVGVPFGVFCDECQRRSAKVRRSRTVSAPQAVDWHTGCFHHRVGKGGGCLRRWPTPAYTTSVARVARTRQAAVSQVLGRRTRAASTNRTQPPWPPTPWELSRPAMGTGTPAQPAAAPWSVVSDAEISLHRWESGEQLTLSRRRPSAGVLIDVRPGAQTIHLADEVTDVVVRSESADAAVGPARHQPGHHPHRRRPRNRRRQERRPAPLQCGTKRPCMQSVPATPPRFVTSPGRQ